MTRGEIMRGLSMAMTLQNVTGGKLDRNSFLTDIGHWIYIKGSGGTRTAEYDPVFNKTTLSIFTGAEHEKFYLMVGVKNNTSYTFQFKLASPTGFSCGGHNYDGNPFYHEFAFVTTATPNLNAFLTSYYEPLGMTAFFDEVMTGGEQSYLYSCSFDSGNNEYVYLVFDCGFITDATTVVFEISDVELVED